jgi:hypothetical protein
VLALLLLGALTLARLSWNLLRRPTWTRAEMEFGDLLEYDRRRARRKRWAALLLAAPVALGLALAFWHHFLSVPQRPVAD